MIRSGPFTGTTLTGEDATTFLRQLDDPPNQKAIETYKRGREMLLRNSIFPPDAVIKVLKWPEL